VKELRYNTVYHYIMTGEEGTITGEEVKGVTLSYRLT
jgi:hypothetical protein